MTHMNTDRIEQIHKATAYPESHSVQQALLQVWNETAHEYEGLIEEERKAYAEWYGYADEEGSPGALAALFNRLKELETAIGKGVPFSAYSFGYADGEREGRTTQLQTQLKIIAERNKLAERVDALERFICDNTDPQDMRPEDSALFHEVNKRLCPKRYEGPFGGYKE